MPNLTPELTPWASEVIAFDPSAYATRPIETVVEQVTMSRNAYHPNPSATVTIKHDGTRFHSVTVENAETMFVLDGSDFDFTPGYANNNFHLAYNGFNLNPNLHSVPLGRTMGWGASIHKRYFVPDWYFQPMGQRAMCVLMGWRINQPQTENPFDHLAGNTWLQMGVWGLNDRWPMIHGLSPLLPAGHDGSAL